MFDNPSMHVLATGQTQGQVKKIRFVFISKE